MILVTGATGTIGGHLVQQLCAAGVPTRALVRSRERADDLRGFDCDIAIGSYDDPASLPPALRDVERVFLLSPPGEASARQEGALVDALPDGVGVVKLAAIRVDSSWGSHVRLLTGHRAVIARLAEKGVPTTVLAPTFFLQNLLRQAAGITAEGVLRAGVGDAAVAHVDARDVAAVAAHCLTSDGHEGATYTVTGPEALTYAQVAQRMSAALGREVRHVDTPAEGMRAGMLAAGVPEWVADGLAELDAAYRDGPGDVVSHEVDKATGRPARTLEDFLATHRAAFR